MTWPQKHSMMEAVLTRAGRRCEVENFAFAASTDSLYWNMALDWNQLFHKWTTEHFPLLFNRWWQCVLPFLYLVVCRFSGPAEMVATRSWTEHSPAIQKGGRSKPHLERLLNNLRQACCAELRLRGVPASSPSSPSPPSLPALHFSDSLRRRRRSSAAPLCHNSRLCWRPPCRDFGTATVDLKMRSKICN